LIQIQLVTQHFVDVVSGHEIVDATQRDIQRMPLDQSPIVRVYDRINHSFLQHIFMTSVGLDLQGIQ